MASFKLSPFTSLGSPNSVVNDDFVHGTLETYKLKGNTTNGGKFDYKIKIKPDTDKKTNTTVLKYDDEGKIQFPIFDKYTVQLAHRRKGDLKAHLDLGHYTLGGKKWNFFTNVKTGVTLTNFEFRVGTNYFGDTCESNTRFEITPSYPVILTHRNYIRKSSLHYGFVASLNLSTLNFPRYDGYLGYNASSYELSIKHESLPKSTNFQIGKVVTSATYYCDANTKVGAELVNTGNVFNPTFSLATQYKVNPELIVKGKINDNLDLSLASKYTLNKQITITVALQIALKSGKPVNFCCFPPLPFGVQLDVIV